MASVIEDKAEMPVLPDRYSEDGISERREHVWTFLSRRVPQTVMAKILGVSRRTISADVKYWKEQCADYVTGIKNNTAMAHADIGLTALRLEGIAQAALGDYELARTSQLKNLFLNTAIKAETARSTLLIHTGVLPKAGEEVRITHNLKATFSDKLGEDSPLAALDNASSRRKVLSAAEKLLRISAEAHNIKQVVATAIDGKPTK